MWNVTVDGQWQRIILVRLTMTNKTWQFRTYQRQQTLRLSNCSAVAEEAKHEHESADADENVNALIDKLRLGESLQGKKIETLAQKSPENLINNSNKWKSGAMNTQNFHFEAESSTK